MISLDAARQALADTIEAHAPSIRAVYPRAVTGPVVTTPAVILAAVVSGRFDEEDALTACAAWHIDSIDLPVAVIVARDGVDEEATQRALEGAWLEVAAALRDHLDQAPLGQVGQTRRLTTLEPSAYVIGATEYPGQLIHVEFLG